MSSLIVSRDSQLMMLELGIKKLHYPKCSPFDSVILSKFIVSFRFLDDEWIDIMPNRLDYRNYRGSSGEDQAFNGGKSMVFGVPEALLTQKQRCMQLEINVRREISRYFETIPGQSHVMNVGQLKVDVDALFNSIVKELRLRCKLVDYLQLAHQRDPISSTLRGCYQLQFARPGVTLDLFVRLSYLGGCVVTEIDRPFRGCDRTHFYAQEERNLGPAYECLQLDPETCPKTKIPITTVIRARPSLQLVCDCSEEQRYKVLLDECSTTRGTCTDDAKKEDDDDTGRGSKPPDQDVGINTDPECADAECGTDGGPPCEEEEVCRPKKDSYVWPKPKRGSGPVNYIPKCVPCPPVCEPCCIPCMPCDIPCMPSPTCLPPVCCYE